MLQKLNQKNGRGEELYQEVKFLKREGNDYQMKMAA